ncbi:MAG: beta-ketoacyl synthase N-terminal-like domain-containing protein, partial [Polaromonas sp.]
MRRVAITGLGVVSAVGSGTPAFFESLLSSRSGIRSIDIPFPTGTENVLAGAIDFDPDLHLPRARLLT